MEAFKRLVMAGVFMAMLALTGYAQYAVQTVTLTKGWNAVYLQVQPDDPRCEAVFADWPVTSVSLYNMSRATGQYTENPSEPLLPSEDYLTWRQGRPAGANSLNTVIAGNAYLIYSTANDTRTRTLTGRPAVPRIDWVTGTVATNYYNFVGFRENGAAKFGTYLAGAGFTMSTPTKFSVYSVSGTNSEPTCLQVGAFTGILTAPIMPGKAYFIACDKVSSFSGPVKVFPAGSDGIVFPANSSRQMLRLKNESGGPLPVTLRVRTSAAAPSGMTPILPALQYFDYLKGWLALTNMTQTLQAGEDWTLPLAVDRKEMAADQLYGGVLVCSDTAGGQVEIPLEVAYGLPDATHAQWPAGLWVGKASLNKVSQVFGDNAITHGAHAGGTLELRLILHVATDGGCRLLQRVILAGAEGTNGAWNAALYVEEKKVPPALKTVRISSVAFGLNNKDITRDDAYYGDQSGFGKNLRFTYTLAADDPVNPFRHPYHPDHDGLKYDFKTKLPTGDNPQTYMEEIKPELFSITNTVSLVWTAAPAPGGGSALWNPSEKVTGDVIFQVGGIRREGPIQMNGVFELKRISQVGTLSDE